MTLTIEHYPDKKFFWCFFYPEFSVDLNKSVREKLNEGEQLTNDIALKILKQIKSESDVLSFLTKSIVAISLSAGLLVAGFCIPPDGTALLVARIFVCTMGGGMIGYSIENSLNGFLSQLSQAYSDQSQRASEYIRTLETTDRGQVLINLR